MSSEALNRAGQFLSHLAGVKDEDLDRKFPATV